MPAAALAQDASGSPQFTAPCGAGVATGAHTHFRSGETIEITIDEAVHHPGHYRVAIALNDASELPPDPVVTPAGVDDAPARRSRIPRSSRSSPTEP